MNADFGQEHWESAKDIFSSFGDFARTSGFSVGESGLLYAGVAIFDFLVNWLEHEKEKQRVLREIILAYRRPLTNLILRH
jgi:hypothetical protein